MNPITTTASHTRFQAEHDSEGHALPFTAALTAAVAFHLLFAVTLIRTGTDAERIYAQQARAEIGSKLADLGSLPTIHVVGRRSS